MALFFIVSGVASKEALELAIPQSREWNVQKLYKLGKILKHESGNISLHNYEMYQNDLTNPETEVYFMITSGKSIYTRLTHTDGRIPKFCSGF